PIRRSKPSPNQPYLAEFVQRRVLMRHTLQYLSPNDWTLLSNKAQRLTFRLGDEIIHAGSRIQYLYIIRSGSAWVELPTAHSAATLAVLEEGDVCGELA